eukprot:TRINITY_DN6771_c0_g1_i1.p1 TRINITY_DN6771_c0_g1~~TRINITY_DN6771_c0_g1_i1.p1  ORF type:complete len:1301 (+),score=414.07 TRINITY_DN6771_c0_g1_i1:81-3983(+)
MIPYNAPDSPDDHPTSSNSSSSSGRSRSSSLSERSRKTNEGYYYYKQAFENSAQDNHAGTNPCRFRDWNDEFQTINDGLAEASEQEKMLKYEELSHLAQDFVYVAKTYGRIIILERYSPIKTIHPVPIGGIAGGEKYIAQGILFKFAVDSHGLYGSDELSAKAAGNELRSLVALYKCQNPGICVPLMSLIDFRGFRLIAMSILPLKQIVYGSQDGGINVHASDPKFNESMRQVAHFLNIKGHQVGLKANPVFIHGPTDIEGHLGKDGRYYALDFQRMFPPELPGEGISKRCILYNLLRPEFVGKYPIPLSSDALSGFGRHDKDIHNEEVKLATEELFNTVIPRFAVFLDSMDEKKIKTFNLIQWMHREGINVRHMGKVRSHTKEPIIRRMLLLEMVCRTIKNCLRSRLRTKMEEIKVPAEEAYKQVVVDYFNLIIGSENTDGNRFWNLEIKNLMLFQFGKNSISAEEDSFPRLIHQEKDLLQMFKRVQQLTGVRISQTAQTQLFNSISTFTFVVPDIEKMSAKVKDMNITAHAEGMALYMQSTQFVGDSADRLFGVAMRKFETALSSTLDNRLTIKSWGEALYAQSKRKTGEERSKLVVQATERLSSIGDYQAIVRFGHELRDLANRTGGQERDRLFYLARMNYKSASQICSHGGDLQDIHMAWGDALVRQSLGKVWEQSLELWEQAGKQYRAALSHGNIPTCDAITKWAQEVSEKDLCTIVQMSKSPNFEIVDSTTNRYITENILTRIFHEFSSTRSLILPNCVVTHQTFSRNLPQLTTLNLSDCNIQDSTVTHITKTCKNLVVLNLHGNHRLTTLGTPEKLLHLTDLDLSDCRKLTNVALFNLNSTPELSELNLSNIQNITTQGIASVASTCPKLGNLNLNNCKKVDGASLVAFAGFHRNFRQINLTGVTDVSKENLILFLNVCGREMTSLKLSGNSNVTDEVLNVVAVKCHQLETLDVSRCKNVGTNSIVRIAENCFKLKHLKLNGNLGIADAAIHALAQHSKSLSSLELGGLYKLSGEGIENIIEKCSHLTVLDLHGTDRIPNDMLVKFFSRAHNISSLNLQDNKNLTDANLSEIVRLLNRNLKKLNLSSCKLISDEALDVLSQHSRNLTSLSLAWNGRFTAPALVKLTTNCALSLQKLDLRECTHLTDEHLAGLYSSPNLTELLLDSCKKISDHPIVKISQHSSLKVVRLVGCFRITDAAVISVAQHSPSLTTLFLGRCYRLTDAAIVKISKHCPSIQLLSLNGCRLISDMSILHLAHSCPQLLKVQLDSCQLITKDALAEMNKGCPFVEISNKS